LITLGNLFKTFDPLGNLSSISQFFFKSVLFVEYWCQIGLRCAAGENFAININFYQFSLEKSTFSLIFQKKSLIFGFENI